MKAIEIILKTVMWSSIFSLVASCENDMDGNQSENNNKIESKNNEENESKNKLAHTIGLYKFELKVKTADMMAKQELKNQRFNHELFEKTKNYFNGSYYFTLCIRRTDSGDDIVKSFGKTDEERTKIISYLSFDMQNNCKIVTEDDTIPCSIYHYERNYGISPYTNINLGFEKSKEPEKIISFIYHDKIFGLNDIKFDLKNTIEKEK